MVQELTPLHQHMRVLAEAEKQGLFIFIMKS
jgi:hypothetical protein